MKNMFAYVKVESNLVVAKEVVKYIEKIAQIRNDKSLVDRLKRIHMLGKEYVVLVKRERGKGAKERKKELFEAFKSYVVYYGFRKREVNTEEKAWLEYLTGVDVAGKEIKEEKEEKYVPAIYGNRKGKCYIGKARKRK